MHQKVIQGLEAKDVRKRHRSNDARNVGNQEEMPDKIGSNKVNNISKTGRNSP